MMDYFITALTVVILATVFSLHTQLGLIIAIGLVWAAQWAIKHPQR